MSKVFEYPNLEQGGDGIIARKEITTQVFQLELEFGSCTWQDEELSIRATAWINALRGSSKLFFFFFQQNSEHNVEKANVRALALSCYTTVFKTSRIVEDDLMTLTLVLNENSGSRLTIMLLSVLPSISPLYLVNFKQIIFLN